MARPPRLQPSRFALAIALSAALVVSAPFIGFIRSWIRTQFPGQFVRIVGAIVAVLTVAAIAAAAVRIRERRARRYGAIAAAVAGAVWYSIAEATGNPDVDVVQRFHFVEYGVIAYLFYRAWRPLADPAVIILPMFAGLIVGTADEWLQWFIPNRVGEIADVFLNGVAIGSGLVFSLGADPPADFSSRFRPGSLSRIGWLGSAGLVAFAGFFHIVHLGYDVRDAEIGTFKSRYSPARLTALAGEKQDEWRGHPPPLALRRISREDQYMTEGVTHAQRRNEALTANDPVAAWKENLILEKFYAPVLDTPSHWSRTGHRWSPGQRADVQARAATAGTEFVSTANPYPIYAWSRAWFWAVALSVAFAFWFACRRADRAERVGAAV
jgi:hypothetical protein